MERLFRDSEGVNAFPVEMNVYGIVHDTVCDDWNELSDYTGKALKLCDINNNGGG